MQSQKAHEEMQASRIDNIDGLTQCKQNNIDAIKYYRNMSQKHSQCYVYTIYIHYNPNNVLFLYMNKSIKNTSTIIICSIDFSNHSNHNYNDNNNRRHVCLLWVIDDHHMNIIRQAKEVEDNRKTIIIHIEKS